MRISGMVRSEVENALDLANFTKDEREVFLLLTKDKSIVEISQKLNISTATVSRIIHRIKQKLERI